MCVCVDSLGSFKRMVVSSVNRYNLTSSPPICVYFFLLPVTLVVFLSTIISEKMKDSCVSFPGLHETVFVFLLCVTLAIGPSYLSLITLRYHLLFLYSSLFLITKEFCVSSKIFCDLVLWFLPFSRRCSG